MCYTCTCAPAPEDPDDPDPPRPRGRARKLKERAKRERISLSDYLRREVLLLSQQLTWEELFEEMDRENRSFDGVEGIDSAELVRQGREHVPHLLDVELTYALRRLLLAGATLVTRDARLARATGHRARIQVV